MLISKHVYMYNFEVRMWDLIVSVPDHCLSFYFEDDGCSQYFT